MATAITTTDQSVPSSSETAPIESRPVESPSRRLSLAGAWIPIITSILAVFALEMVATDTEVPPPAWVETWSLIALVALMAGLFALGQRSRWGWAGAGVFAAVLLGMAVICYADGHRNAALTVQAVSGVAVLASIRASARIG